MNDAEKIIKDLKLEPHPEGGHFIECFKTSDISIIYYLLKKNERQEDILVEYMKYLDKISQAIELSDKKLEKLDLKISPDHYSGKVRENFYKDDEIIMVTSDRVSAFDFVFNNTII